MGLISVGVLQVLDCPGLWRGLAVSLAKHGCVLLFLSSLSSHLEYHHEGGMKDVCASGTCNIKYL